MKLRSMLAGHHIPSARGGIHWQRQSVHAIHDRWRTQPERDVTGLHGLLDGGDEVSTQLVQARPLRQRHAIRREKLSGVILAAKETPVYLSLDLRIKRGV